MQRPDSETPWGFTVLMAWLALIFGSLAYLAVKFSDPIAHAIVSVIPHAGPL